MVYRIKITSPEEEDFLREIKIDEDATFLQFCQTLLKSCHYADDQMTSFYLLDADRQRRAQITREDMGCGPEDEDVFVMEKTRIAEIITEEGLRLEFVFDTFSDRYFTLRVVEELPGEHLDTPQVSRRSGRAPEQIRMPLEEIVGAGLPGAGGADDDDYDDAFGFGAGAFNDDELDLDGYEISEQ